ncbi:MAG: S53 family peptidase [Burkholderiales bacterium]|nr:S53 family peptidase [Burkholderiales bacterium]
MLNQATNLSFPRARLLTCAAAVIGLFAVTAPSASASGIANRHGVDQGALSAGTLRPVSFAMKLPNLLAAEAYARDVADPTSANYHKFLSVDEFRTRFGPSADSIQQVTRYLQAAGFRNVTVDASGLLVHGTATVGQLNSMLSTEIHSFVDAEGNTFHAPTRRPTLPAALASANVLMVSGLSSVSHLKPHLKHVSVGSTTDGIPLVLPAVGHTPNSVPSTATNTPGSYTVGDLAVRYNVAPLYNRGITGKGTTIGIATLADFVPADAFTYWNTIGLSVDPSRITQVHVDGGAGAPSGASGSGETSLDVEQSGGLAPDAKIIVYDAPNTDAGFMDVFSAAVSANKVDVLSVSWGSPETFYLNSAIDGNVDNTSELVAMHNVFVQAAMQGISVFAASGDSGAYDSNRDLPYPQFTKALTVDAPASDPFVTAAGGTTVPVTLQFHHPVTTVTVPQERPWAWDYLSGYITAKYGPDAVYTYLFSTGGGGGVSVLWPMPLWQFGLPGAQLSATGQAIAQNDGSAPFLTLRSNFPGRNLPDVSLNADPETGYSVVSSTDSPSTGGWITGYGGTSFVAPQLAGITALLTQSAGHRMGLITPRLYTLLAFTGYGPTSPFNALSTGDNWYYNANGHYSPAAGLGTLNVDNLARWMR